MKSPKSQSHLLFYCGFDTSKVQSLSSQNCPFLIWPNNNLNSCHAFIQQGTWQIISTCTNDWHSSGATNPFHCATFIVAFEENSMNIRNMVRWESWNKRTAYICVTVAIAWCYATGQIPHRNTAPQCRWHSKPQCVLVGLPSSVRFLKSMDNASSSANGGLRHSSRVKM